MGLALSTTGHLNVMNASRLSASQSFLLSGVLHTCSEPPVLFRPLDSDKEAPPAWVAGKLEGHLEMENWPGLEAELQIFVTVIHLWR